MLGKAGGKSHRLVTPSCGFLCQEYRGTFEPFLGSSCGFSVHGRLMEGLSRENTGRRKRIKTTISRASFVD